MKTIIIIIMLLSIALLPFRSRFDNGEKCKKLLYAGFNTLSNKRIYFILCVMQLVLAFLAGFTVYKYDAMTLGDLAYDNESSIDRFFILNDTVFLSVGIIAWIFVCALSVIMVRSNFKVKGKRSGIVFRFILQLISVPLTFAATVFYLERNWMMF